jgi:hypothetical protein
VRPQAFPLSERFSSTWFNTHKWLLAGVRSQVSRQLASFGKRFSTAWFSAYKGFLAGVSSKV